MKPSGISFKEFLLNRNHTLSTIKSYEYVTQNFLRANPHAESYTYRDIFEYFKHFIVRFPKRPNISLIQSAIKKWYDYQVYIGNSEHHPCKRLFLKQRPKALIHQDLFTSPELEKLLFRRERYPCLKYRNKMLISLLIYQGITLTEMVNLKIKNFDMDKGTVWIRGTKTTCGRKLTLRPIQLNFLEKYLNWRLTHLNNHSEYFAVKHAPFMINKLGKPMTADDMHYIVETFKYHYPDRKLCPQTIRQSVIANWLNDRNKPLEQVQLLAGHKWLSSTQKYRQKDIAEQVEMINKFHPVF